MYFHTFNIILLNIPNITHMSHLFDLISKYQYYKCQTIPDISIFFDLDFKRKHLKYGIKYLQSALTYFRNRQHLEQCQYICPFPVISTHNWGRYQVTRSGATTIDLRLYCFRLILIVKLNCFTLYFFYLCNSMVVYRNPASWVA